MASKLMERQWQAAWGVVVSVSACNCQQALTEKSLNNNSAILMMTPRGRSSEEDFLTRQLENCLWGSSQFVYELREERRI
mmetsp:Transcript_29883/g.69610  ORF Transcript_29883/g.69610 Transcript_29883/m.69610 type:complete len:80 (+) Transcript_29883:495-734(+)